MAVIDPIAAGIKTTIVNIAGLSGSVTMKGFKWPPKAGDVDRLPAAVVYVPRVTRTEVGPDVPEDHLGFRDFHLDFPVHLYFAADNVEFASAQVVEVVEAFINAIDASMDPTKALNGLCDDVKVTEVDEPTESTTPSNRTIWEVRSRVQVVVFVP